MDVKEFTLDNIKASGEKLGWDYYGRTENQTRVKDTYLTSNGVLVVRLYKQDNRISIHNS